MYREFYISEPLIMIYFERFKLCPSLRSLAEQKLKLQNERDNPHMNEQD